MDEPVFSLALCCEDDHFNELYDSLDDDTLDDLEDDVSRAEPGYSERYGDW